LIEHRVYSEARRMLDGGMLVVRSSDLKVILRDFVIFTKVKTMPFNMP